MIVEAADSVGSAWRSRWDSLVLFTSRRHDALRAAFPGDEGTRRATRSSATGSGTALPAADHALELGRIADEEGDVRGCPPGEKRILADQVVVATGPLQVPNMPGNRRRSLQRGLPDAQHVGIADRRMSPAGRVLVVGGGNGFQIAKELAGSREVHLAIGSRQTPLPQRLLGRDLFWWLTKLGLLSKTVESPLAGAGAGPWTP